MTVRLTPRLEGRLVPAELIGELKDSSDVLSHRPALRRRLAEDGYLLLRGGLDRDEVLAARREVFARLAEVGEVREPAAEGIATGSSRRAEIGGELGAFWRSVCEGPALRRLTHAGRLRRIAARVFGCPVRPFDFLWLRAMAAERASPLHFDHVYMNRGTDRVLSAWVPLGDVPAGEGPLLVVEGSHRFDDLIAAYRGHDVDRDPSRPGHLGRDAVGLARQRGGRLLTADFQASDVVLFGMFTLHGSFDNASQAGRVRLSCDVRYQPRDARRDDRWFGSPPPGHGGKSYGGLSGARPLTAEMLLR
ncbi:MAG: phytanoyl-CoA dioxygenase family protein [Pseudomonadota bacterium]